MAFNLVQAVEARLSPKTVEHVASHIGEDTTTTRGAISTGVLAIIAGFAKAASSPTGSADLLARLRATSQAGASDEELDLDREQPEGLHERGQALIAGHFGGGAARLADAVAHATGLGRHQGASVVSMLAPLVTGALAREVVTRRLDAVGLTKLLGDERSSILARGGLPAGLGALLGGERDEAAVGAAPPPSDVAETAGAAPPRPAPEAREPIPAHVAPTADVEAPTPPPAATAADVKAPAPPPAATAADVKAPAHVAPTAATATDVKAPAPPPAATATDVKAPAPPPAATAADVKAPAHVAPPAATATDVKAPAHVAPTAGVKEPAHVAPETTDVKEPAPPAARRRKPIGWIVAIAAAAGLLVLGLLFSSSRHRETGPDTSARAPERIEHAPQVPRGPMVPNLPTPTAQHEPTSETTTTGAVLGPAELDEHFAGTGPTPDRVEAPLTFDPSGTLSGDGAIAIDRIATLMKDHPSTRIRLEGLGGALDETLAHAERVKGMLVERGVDPGRVETAAQPSEPGATDQPREEGRRVAIVILAR